MEEEDLMAQEIFKEGLLIRIISLIKEESKDSMRMEHLEESSKVSEEEEGEDIREVEVEDK